MLDSTLVIVFLGLMSVSLVVITATLLITARDLRRTLARVNTMLPQCHRTVTETQRTLEQLHRLLSHSNQTVSHLEASTRTMSRTILGIIAQVAGWALEAQTFFAERFGNGAGAEPRHQKRSSWNRRRDLQ